MPRTARASVGGICNHVINRGNARGDVFLKDADYEAFLKAMSHACVEIAMPVLAYCLMPNHFHLVVWPKADGDLSGWMHWLLNAHVRRYHKHYHSSGHIWQGRFKAFPIQQDEHLLTVLRYVERNAVRPGLVKRAERWSWPVAGPWYSGAIPGSDGETWHKVDLALRLGRRGLVGGSSLPVLLGLRASVVPRLKRAVSGPNGR